VVAPLERRSRKALDGDGLDDCLAAFAENAEGFAWRADAALARTKYKNSLGLLVKMVRAGEHRVPPAAPSVADVNPSTGCTHGNCIGEEACLYA